MHTQSSHGADGFGHEHFHDGSLHAGTCRPHLPTADDEFDHSPKSVYAAYMATKTISVDLDAYERLCAARLNGKDSFSQVIKRAHWLRPAKTCAALLATLPAMPVADDKILDQMEAAQRDDEPPDNSWE